ncbi:hypothetical protein BGZ61DRAFT_79035 [Ilyonectria robusta]|uniref:uncharacterized protein n=1 Tax=Ilyonectria robusta TaxID=1079257 RepID=UPI001E8CED1F|nr:uncharacterized protein BGZ61DRAFT_79035 [Ilyonectria robusta]KAH8735438.1 hypothetical protein BGZ61DRAFT_79035 [Ilyonectria robusta]
MSHLSYSFCRVPAPTDPPLHVLLHPHRSTCRKHQGPGVSGMGHFPGAGDGEVICHGSQAFGVGVVAMVLSEGVLAETLAAFETRGVSAKGGVEWHAKRSVAGESVGRQRGAELAPTMRAADDCGSARMQWARIDKKTYQHSQVSSQTQQQQRAARQAVRQLPPPPLPFCCCGGACWYCMGCWPCGGP